MSTHWQDDPDQSRDHDDGETPVMEARGHSAQEAILDDRAELRDEAHHLLKEIAKGYCYIGIARWSRDAVAVRTNLRCALHVLRNIDAQMHHVQSTDLAWRKVQTASDHLRNRLMEAFSNLLDQVVHELPRHGRISKRVRDDGEPGMPRDPSDAEHPGASESDSSAHSEGHEASPDHPEGSSPSSGEASSALAPEQEEGTVSPDGGSGEERLEDGQRSPSPAP